MATERQTIMTTQVYRVYIKATPERIFDAITKPEWTERYGYTARAEYDLRPGGAWRSLANDAMRTAGAEMGYEIPDVVADGEVVEVDRPHRLVQTWRMLMSPATAAEGFTRLTWEIDQVLDGVCRVTVTHELEGAPQTAALVAGALEDTGAGGGWPDVLSDLKSLLETGQGLRG